MAFKTLGLGRLVGNPTGGGVIWTGSSRLINGASIRTPFSLAVTWDPTKPNNYGINLENYGVEPEVWVAQLNEYLGQMSDAIFEYDGYLDKFMGDGIMAIWNTFGTQPDHASLAAKASLEMLRRLEILNGAWERMDNRTPFRIGVAIHSGEAIIGNVGSDERMQYTAIGDTVNTAARIEGMTKEYGVQFLASETTAAQLAEGIVELADIGEAQVRGRAEGIRLFARPDEYAQAQQAKADEDKNE